MGELNKDLEHYEPAVNLHYLTPGMLDDQIARLLLGFNDWLNYHIAEPRYQESSIPDHFGFVQALFENVLAKSGVWDSEPAKEWRENRGY